MTEETIAMFATGFGVIATVIWLWLFRKGVRSVEEIRDELKNRR